MLESAAERLHASIITGRPLSSIELATLLDTIAAMDGYEQLLRLLLAQFENTQRAGTMDAERTARSVRAINESYYQGELYNQEVKMMGQGLYYTLLEVR